MVRAGALRRRARPDDWFFLAPKVDRVEQGFVGHKKQAASYFFLQGARQSGHVVEQTPYLGSLRHGERGC